MWLENSTGGEVGATVPGSDTVGSGWTEKLLAGLGEGYSLSEVGSC